MDLAKVARAIEADVGQALPGMYESLADAKQGKFAQTHTPEEISEWRHSQPVGSTLG